MIASAPSVDWDRLVSGWLEGALKHLPAIFLIIAGALVMNWVCRRLIGSLEKRVVREDTATGRGAQRSKTLGHVVRGAVSVVTWSMAGLMVLGEVGLDLGPLLAGAGIIGIALGFGAQSLVRDFFSGFFVLLEDQYRIGDIVEIDGVTGVVETFTLRHTALRSLDGTLHHISNGNVQRASNSSAGWSRAIVDIGVDYSQDVEQVKEAVRIAGNALTRDPVKTLIIEPPEVLGLEAFGESRLTLRIAVKVMPGQRATVERALRHELKRAFDQKGISIPFTAPGPIRPEPNPRG